MSQMSQRDTSADSQATTSTHPPQLPSFRRWLVGAFLGLWWIFIGALAVGVAQYVGNHAGPLILPLLPQVVDWARAQPLWVQIGLGVLALGVFALMGWLTFLAWKHRQAGIRPQEPLPPPVATPPPIRARDAHGWPNPNISEDPS